MVEKNIKELLEFSVININKPSGPTSYQVSEYIRSRLNLRKTSHMGTLDPAVSGVLPITLNRACKLSPFLMHKNKKYIGIMRLHEKISENKIKEEVSRFVGKIKQKPPVRSNVKRAIREREVMSFRILEIEGKDVLFETEVEAGTYIRTLINDLGKVIGGAHMLELRRTRAGSFDENKSFSLYDFDNAIEKFEQGDEKILRNMIVPADKIVLDIMPCLKIRKDNLSKILTGKPIHEKDIIGKSDFDKGQILCVLCEKRLVEVAKVVKEGEVFAKPEFVLN